MAGGDGFAMSGMFEGGQQVRALEHSNHRTCIAQGTWEQYIGRETRFCFATSSAQRAPSHSVAQHFVLSMGFAKNVGRHSFSTIMEA